MSNIYYYTEVKHLLQYINTVNDQCDHWNSHNDRKVQCTVQSNETLWAADRSGS